MSEKMKELEIFEELAVEQGAYVDDTTRQYYFGTKEDFLHVAQRIAAYARAAAPSPELISPHPIVEELTKE
jgi:hypothetical protein